MTILPCGYSYISSFFLFCLIVPPVLADDDARANSLLVEAVQLVQAAEDETVAQKKLNLLKQAYGNLQTIMDAYPSTDLAVKLITGQQIGDLSLAGVVEAVEAAKEAVEIPKRYDCQESPTYACVMSLALVTADSIKYANLRALAFSSIAVSQAEAGQIDQAHKTWKKAKYWAKPITGNTDYVAALNLIAVSQAEAGQIDQALVTAKSIRGDVAVFHAMKTRVQAVSQAEAGQIDQALVTAKSIRRREDRAMVLSSIAVAQTEAGQFKQALVTARSIEFVDDRAMALGAIAGALAQAEGP